MHKSSTSSLLLPISHLFSQIQLRHSYSTRNSCNLSLASYSSSTLQSSFVYKDMELWNAIPPLIRKYNFKKFNGELRKLLASEQFDRANSLRLNSWSFRTLSQEKPHLCTYLIFLVCVVFSCLYFSVFPNKNKMKNEIIFVKFIYNQLNVIYYL